MDLMHTECREEALGTVVMDRQRILIGKIDLIKSIGRRETRVIMQELEDTNQGTFRLLSTETMM